MFEVAGCISAFWPGLDALRGQLDLRAMCLYNESVTLC